MPKPRKKHAKPRDPADTANELYARGYAETRLAALAMIANEPDLVATIMAFRVGPEMRSYADRAQIEEWGHAGTGTDPLLGEEAA